MGFKLHTTPYKFNDRKEFITVSTWGIKKYGSYRKVEYYNVACSFDIETSSTYINGEKVANMYVWQFGLNGYVIMGRTWKEFLIMLKDIAYSLDLHQKRRLMVFVHNLSYEFQFMAKWLEWDNIFSKDERKPIYAVSSLGIEFRCSYFLSGYSLEKVGEHLTTYKVEKLVGNLDYDKIRHSETPLTDEEIAYCVNDVLVVMAYIQELIDKEFLISRIPLTKTGYIRRYCKKSCMRKEGKSIKKFETYRRIMKSLIIQSQAEYMQLKRGFQGGFTHANAYKVNSIIQDVYSFDFTSSYPFVMLSEKFPMSRGVLVEIKDVAELKRYLNLYCCLFDITLYNISPKLTFENPLSSSKCWELEKPVINNGRVVTAEKITTTLTEQDFWILTKFYKWDKTEIFNCRIYEKDYLPTNFIKAILELYKNKTELKDVEGKEIEYLNSKELLNSCYGMSVTDIVHDIISYDVNSNWNKEKGDIEKDLQHYNTSKNRFLFYPWGVWVTAYARKNLFTGILECGEDYIYADTDSVKFTNYEKHKSYFDEYNKYVLEKLKLSAYSHNIPFEVFTPKTIEGDTKIMGVWELDGHYKRFKTLGAKRYIVDDYKKGINITVAGVGKKTALKYMLNKWGEDKIFNAFNEFLVIPKEHTGKMTHTYFDTGIKTKVKDYRGVWGTIEEKSYTHLEKAEFTLSLTSQYLDYLKGIKTVEA